MSDIFSFDKDSLINGFLGGSLITSAVIGMNTGLSKPVSMAAFTAGWFFVIKSFNSQTNRDSQTNDVMSKAAIIVWLSAMSLRMMMDSNVSGLPMKIGGLLFMGGWLTIGNNLNSRTNTESLDKLYGFSVPLLIFASMASINGFERPKAIASGPGVFLFSTAWVVLSLMNSIHK